LEGAKIEPLKILRMSEKNYGEETACPNFGGDRVRRPVNVKDPRAEGLPCIDVIGEGPPNLATTRIRRKIWKKVWNFESPNIGKKGRTNGKAEGVKVYWSSQ